jgi:hypothetical protein
MNVLVMLQLFSRDVSIIVCTCCICVRVAVYGINVHVYSHFFMLQLLYTGAATSSWHVGIIRLHDAIISHLCVQNVVHMLHPCS